MAEEDLRAGGMSRDIDGGHGSDSARWETGSAVDGTGCEAIGEGFVIAGTGCIVGSDDAGDTNGLDNGVLLLICGARKYADGSGMGFWL